MAAPGITTRRFALSPAEWVTSAIAAVVSATAYVAVGFPYLARGVVGDLAGFLMLGLVGAAAGARVQHEAIICLVCIIAVLLLTPAWPLQLAEPLWWLAFSAGLAVYVVLRRRWCD